MQGKKLIATLLVHLRTEDQYEEENQASIQKNLRRVWRPAFGTLDEWLKSETAKNLISDYSRPPWRFNDIVGYVQVAYDGGNRVMTIGFLPKKRIDRRLTRKIFYHYGIPGYGKIFDSHVLPPLTEARVREALSTTLDDTYDWFSEMGLHLEYDRQWFECLDLKKLLALNA